MRVAVIGAGIVGASVAFRLSQGGARVCIIDQGGPASGTTSASFAWLNANNKTPREYFELNRAGMKEYVRLGDELPDGAPWLHRSGNLIQAPDKDLEELEQRVERLRSWGYAAEWWTASRVTAELEPHVTFPEPNTPVAFFLHEGWIDAPLLTNRLVELAGKNGGETCFGTAVEHIETTGGRVEEVVLSDGSSIPADVVVNAAGARADRTAAMVGRELPLSPRRGLLARIRAVGEPLRRLLHTPEVNLRPDGRGHILLHHGSVDERLEEGEAVEDLDRELLARARRVLSGLDAAEIEEIRIGVRPIPSDGYPCVGGIAEIPGYYEVVTHSGVTLGPLIGRLLAQEVLNGEVDSLLTPFRPNRFDF